MKTNTERRKFFKKAGVSAISTGVMGLLPFKLFAHSQGKNGTKNPQSNVNITIDPMAVKREKRK